MVPILLILLQLLLKPKTILMHNSLGYSEALRYQNWIEFITLPSFSCDHDIVREEHLFPGATVVYNMDDIFFKVELIR